jgi:hypothetical protein
MLDLLAMVFVAGLPEEAEKLGSTQDNGSAFLFQPTV